MRRCNGEAFADLEEEMKTIADIMNTTHQKARGVYSAVMLGEEWSNETQKAFAAFMDLLTQYHNSFIKGEVSILDEAIKGLNEMNLNLSEFYTDCENIRRLEGM